MMEELIAKLHNEKVNMGFVKIIGPNNQNKIIVLIKMDTATSHQ